mgnify:CR=1 FL=1
MACSIYKITESHTALAKRMNRLPMKALMDETFPEIYGQLFITGMRQLSGIDRLAPTLAPRMSRTIGDWTQGDMDKSMERRTAALD